jgi:hypothetical protein
MKNLIILLVVSALIGLGLYVYFDQNEPPLSAGISSSEYNLNLPSGFSILKQTDKVLELNGYYILDPEVKALYHFDLYQKDPRLTLEQWIDENYTEFGYTRLIFSTDPEVDCLTDTSGRSCEFDMIQCYNLEATTTLSETTNIYDCGNHFAYYFLVNNASNEVIAIKFGQDPPISGPHLVQVVSFK